ncbi:MAG: SCP2 sterol-binding domain-containing protein [Acidimicrobiales bacterium]
MARFLSPEWFDEVRRHSGAPLPDGGADRFELEQVVTSTPYGEVRYRVVVAGGSARVAPEEGRAGSAEPDLTIRCEWETAAAMARGELSAQAAVMDGRLRVHGNLARLAGAISELAGADAVPATVRRDTTY